MMQAFSRLGGLLVLPGILCLVLFLLLFQPIYAQGTMKWSFDTGGAIWSSPAIGDEGVIIVGSLDNFVYGVNPDGTMRWSFDVGADVRQPVAVGDDGTIYVGDQTEGQIIALNPDGTEKWTFDSELDESVTGEIAIGADGTIYAGIGGAQTATVYAINPDGSQFWTFTPNTSTRGIAVGPEGVIAITDGNGGIYLLDSLGALQWNVDFTNGINAPVIFGEDGTIFYGSNFEFAALNLEDGSLKWEIPFDLSGESPSTGADGTIYVPLAASGTSGGIAALNPEDGSEKWRFAIGNRVQTSPAVGLDGTIYFGTQGDQLIAIDSTGTEKWRFDAGSDIVSSPTIAENGTLYFGSNDSLLYALNTASAGLAASSWPKKQRDVRNTGRLGSDTARRRFFAPHSFDLRGLELGNAVLTMRHTGGLAASPAGIGTTANFRVDVRNRDGSLLFSLDESVEPGETRDIDLVNPGNVDYQGSVVVDAPIKDGLVLAPFLTWVLDLGFNAPLQIGAFFSDATEAAQVHYAPAEASATNGLGIAVQNIGDDQISCNLDFLNEDGTAAGQEIIVLAPLGSRVDFFNDSVADGFKGSITLTCDAPVVAVAVNQDSANGSFPTDRLTIKGLN